MKLFLRLLPLLLLASCAPHDDEPVIDRNQLAQHYFKEDAQWYLDNIPFFECSDKQMEQVYYYRWKMYKAHIRNVGQNEYVITEFINHVPWDREPFCTINAASMHHIYEGRWLKNGNYMDGYINNLYQQGGNDRRYSESIGDAAYARFLVNQDAAFLLTQLDSMIKVYNGWSDHFDTTRQMYWIPAMPDATEYTIASIDASGGTAGFDGGEAFRPTINSYMYANAKAISKIAAMKGDSVTSLYYLQKAGELKWKVELKLWNDFLHHFTDRYKQENQYVKNWDYIRGRELAGMIPWYFNLPSNNPKFNVGWKHVLDTSELLGPYGLRTNEPSYQYYFKQFVWFDGARGSQWNGPSWPYQTSQVLTGMANFLNLYDQNIAKNADYVKLLRLYTQQHFLNDSTINLVENYDPNLGGPIVYYYWSNHYNHSSYNNLIISGLCGIRPSESDTLTLNPLVDSTIKYFCLDDVQYHGHKLTVIYDEDGAKYNLGKGLTVRVDDKEATLHPVHGQYQVVIGKPIVNRSKGQALNYALNIRRTGYPIPSASINTKPDTSLYQAIDGRIWYFPEITNRWTTLGSTASSDWYALDFGQPKEISAVKLYLFADKKMYDVPDEVTIEYKSGDQWLPMKLSQQVTPLIGNTVNTIQFNKITASQIRINFKHSSKQVAVSEIECYQ